MRELLSNKIKKKLKRDLLALLTSLMLFSCSEPTSPVKTSTPIKPSQPPTQENRLPVINSSPITQVNEVSFYEYAIQATDPDGDPLTYSLIEKPSWLSILGNRVYGNSPEVLQDQSSSVRVRVSDGKGGNADQFYNLTVKNLYNVHVLSENQLNQLLRVDGNILTFSQPVNFSLNDVIVAGTNQIMKYGFLGEIINISPDRKTVQTKYATLEQTVANASFSNQVSLLPSDISYSISKSGVSQPLSGQGFNFNIKLENVILYDIYNNPNIPSGKVIMNGEVLFNLNFSFDFNISNRKMNNLTFKNISEEKVDIKVQISPVLGTIFNEVELVKYKFNPIVAYIPPLIPVVFVPELSINAGIVGSMDHKEVKVTQEANLIAGLSYQNNSWLPISSFSNNFNFSFPGPERPNFNYKAYAGPKLNLLLYGIIGPSGGLNTYLEINSVNQNWKLYGGLEAILNIKSNLLSKIIPDYSAKVLDFKKVLLEGGIQPITGGEILFTSTRDGNGEIYSMNADGSQQTNLTMNNSPDYEASWSPDNKEIVFVSERDGNPEIYRMRIGSITAQKLTNNSATDRQPNWSPNSQEIVFYSQRDGSESIWLMNADGSNQRKLNLPFGVHGWPRWSPDGTRLVFMSTLAGEGNIDIYVVNKDGTGLRRLTNNPAADVEPSWCGNGRIVFSSNRTTNYYKIMIMNSDGSNQVELSSTLAGIDDYSPSCSPDGTKIVYSFGNVNRHSSDIYIMNIDGSNKKRLTTRSSSTTNTTPFWK